MKAALAAGDRREVYAIKLMTYLYHNIEVTVQYAKVYDEITCIDPGVCVCTTHPSSGNQVIMDDRPGQVSTPSKGLAHTIAAAAFERAASYCIQTNRHALHTWVAWHCRSLRAGCLL